MKRYCWIGVCCSFFILSCQKQNKLFEKVAINSSGIDFRNSITTSDTFNILTFEYIYNGGGVGIADFNQDGLQDIYFSGNQVSSRLYLNQGNFKFEDTTEKSVVATNRWATGVAITDINQDGLPDIYVCVSGNPLAAQRANYLFVNQGNNQFAEQAAQYGIADTSYTNQAAFFDYDLDGDLDLYLLTTSNDGTARNTIREKFEQGEAENTDILYRNNGDGTFTNVSKQTGILIEGFGLGLSVTDINQDGWPDIYVSNDYLSNDILYVNQQDGTFKNEIATYFRHQSNFAMGNDIADINNDGLQDVITLDMLPKEHYREKMMSGAMNYDRFLYALEFDYEPQYMRNTVQLNAGNGFNEVGCLLGVQNTDWSWSPLLADFDNDGDRDLTITNGYRKDITDMDFIVYRQRIRSQEALGKAIDSLPGAKIRNFAFENKGNFQFEDVSTKWGFEETSYSNGAAYADLDNDGDLDYVVNNIDDHPFIFENKSEQIKPGNYLRLQLHGPKGNREGIFSKVHIYQQGKHQMQQFSPYRGFQSSVEPVLHFGLVNAQPIDSLIIIWPDGKLQKMTAIDVNRVLTLKHKDADNIYDYNNEPETKQQVFEAAERIQHQHQENEFIDFKYEPLLPHLYSQEGPALTVGDVNGDGLEDLYIGGAKGCPGYFYLQQNNGDFLKKKFAHDDSLREDVAAELFDLDGDQDLDLYVVSGGNEEKAGKDYYQDRLYLNDGIGNFRKSEDLPLMNSNGSCVTVADFDLDGDPDVFVGGYVKPRSYPKPDKSCLLLNQEGQLQEVTGDFAPGLSEVGLVKEAEWTDVNSDNYPDLVIAGEWMPITIFINQAGNSFTKLENDLLAQTKGWWNSVAGGDFDNDGDVDFILGNLGLNSDLKASEKHPIELYANDYDQNGTLDAVIGEYVQGKLYPIHPRDAMLDQMQKFRMRVPKYSDYARQTLPQLLPEDAMENAYHLQANTFASVYVENKENGEFITKPLPVQAQFAPVNAIQVADHNGDGHLDALLAGNSRSTEILTGWYNALDGLWLQGDGAGSFAVIPASQSGFKADGVGRAIETLNLANGNKLILVGQNDGALLGYQLKNSEIYP